MQDARFWVLIVHDKQLADSVNTNVARMGLEICYSSIYDRCWRIKQQFLSGFAIPEAVEICEGNEERQFRN